jgi:hypothetical protein
MTQMAFKHYFWTALICRQLLVSAEERGNKVTLVRPRWWRSSVTRQNVNTSACGRAVSSLHPIRADPCGGGVEYLHRDPASRRRRRKGKSRVWDSKIWPRVLMTALARASSNCKRQTRPLVREGTPN